MAGTENIDFGEVDESIQASPPPTLSQLSSSATAKSSGQTQTKGKADRPQPSSTRPHSSAAENRGGNGFGSFYFRLLISSREASGVIGKQGINVASIRDEFGVRISVNKAQPGVNERICIVTGNDFLSSVKASVRAAEHARPSNLPEVPPVGNGSTNWGRQLVLRYLVPNACIGGVIGQSGNTIKSLMQASGCRIVISKQVLPQSTERVVEICGTSDQILNALEGVSRIVYDDVQGRHTVIYYDTKNSSPIEHSEFSYSSSISRQGYGGVSGRIAYSGDEHRGRSAHSKKQHGKGSKISNLEKSTENTLVDLSTSSKNNTARSVSATSPTSPVSASSTLEQRFEVDSRAVGALIGLHGRQIEEIREQTGATIKVRKSPQNVKNLKLVIVNHATQEGLDVAVKMCQKIVAQELEKLDADAGSINVDS